LKKGGVVVNSHARSISNKHVYAIGDTAADYPMLAPVSVLSSIPWAYPTSSSEIKYMISPDHE